MEFASQVRVYAPGQVFLFRATPKKAEWLLRQGGARRWGDGRVVRAIEVAHTLSTLPHSERQEPTPTTVRDYMGQTYTYRQRLRNADGEVDHRVVQLKPIHSALRDLFRLSVTDCLEGQQPICQTGSGS